MRQLSFPGVLFLTNLTGHIEFTLGREGQRKRTERAGEISYYSEAVFSKQNPRDAYENGSFEVLNVNSLWWSFRKRSVAFGQK